MKLSTVFLVAFSSLALAVANPDPADQAVQVPTPANDELLAAGQSLKKGQKMDKKMMREAADQLAQSLEQNVPPKYNKHVENVPVFKNHKGDCNCSPAVCPPSRILAELVWLPRAMITSEMTDPSQIPDCESSHAWACWRQNSACPKPIMKQKVCTT